MSDFKPSNNPNSPEIDELMYGKSKRAEHAPTLTSSPDPSPTNRSQSKFSHRFLSFTATVLILALTATTAFFLYQNSKLKSELINRQLDESARSLNSKPLPSTPTPDPTINWKTYTDPNNRYSFRYPDNWFLLTSSSGVSPGIVSLSNYDPTQDAKHFICIDLYIVFDRLSISVSI